MKTVAITAVFSETYKVDNDLSDKEAEEKAKKLFEDDLKKGHFSIEHDAEYVTEIIDE